VHVHDVGEAAQFVQVLQHPPALQPAFKGHEEPDAGGQQDHQVDHRLHRLDQGQQIALRRPLPGHRRGRPAEQGRGAQHQEGDQQPQEQVGLADGARAAGGGPGGLNQILRHAREAGAGKSLGDPRVQRFQRLDDELGLQVAAHGLPSRARD